jgi:hypothetical protein
VRLLLRPLHPGELDHELLWSLVGLSLSVLIALWAAVGGPQLLPCAFRTITGIPCPTCGSTRALLALLEGHVVVAARLNPLTCAAALLVPIYVLYGLATVAMGLPRVRVELDAPRGRAARMLILGVCGTAWLFLVADGR